MSDERVYRQRLAGTVDLEAVDRIRGSTASDSGVPQREPAAGKGPFPGYPERSGGTQLIGELVAEAADGDDGSRV